MAAKNNSAVVLLVDDEDCIRKSLSYILREMGFETQEAKNGRDALDKIMRDRPDIVIIDVAMPVMDGVETCEQLRKNLDTRDIPIILLSAQERVESMVSGLPGPKIKSAGKPWDIKYIAEQIRLAVLLSRQ